MFKTIYSSKAATTLTATIAELISIDVESVKLNAQKALNKKHSFNKHAVVEAKQRKAAKAEKRAAKAAAKAAVAEATKKAEAEAAAKKAEAEAEEFKRIAVRFGAALKSGKFDYLTIGKSTKAKEAERKLSEKIETRKINLRAIKEIVGDLEFELERQKYIISKIEEINHRIEQYKDHMLCDELMVDVSEKDYCKAMRNIAKLHRKIEIAKADLVNLAEELSKTESRIAELRSEEHNPNLSDSEEKAKAIAELQLEVVANESCGGNKLEHMAPVYHRVVGSTRLIAVMEYENSITELPEYSTNTREASILRYDWTKAGYIRPLIRWTDDQGRKWLILTASQKDLKDGGEIMAEESFIAKNSAVLNRPATTKLNKTGKAAGMTVESALREWEDRWDRLAEAEMQEQTWKNKAEKLYEESVMHPSDAIDDAQSDAAAKAAQWKAELEIAQKAFKEAETWFKRSPSKWAKWTTQKAIQTIALALTPSRSIGVILKAINSAIMNPVTYEGDVLDDELLSKVSCIRGRMQLKLTRKYKNTGWDGQFYLSLTALKQAVADGELSKADYDMLVNAGAVQVRGYNPDQDGWFALKGVAIIIDDTNMAEAEVIDFDGRKFIWKRGMHILTTDVVKDTALYKTTDATGHEKFFAQKRQLRLCAFNWECGKVETGRQSIQPLTQMTRDEINEAIDETVIKLQESRTPNQYRETVLRRIRSILPDLTAEQFHLLEPLWMHPSMTMSEVKSKFCAYNSALAGSLKVNGISGIVVGEVQAHLQCLLYGADPRTAGTLKSGEVRIPKKSGILPGTVGMAERYPYTSPLYKEVVVVGYTTGNFIEVSMQNGELIMAILSMDFDGDHMAIYFDRWFVIAARRSNEMHKQLGATYLIYDDNGSEDWIACCHKAEYIKSAPTLGSAGIATAPLFLLFSLIPSAVQWEKKFGATLNKDSYATFIFGKKRVYVILKEEITQHGVKVTREFVDKPMKDCVKIGEIMEWIMYISADVTWQVDAVKRAASSPFAASIQGKRMHAFCKNLYAASQWHDHMFDKEVINMRDDPKSEKKMIEADSLCVIDRIMFAIQTRFKLKLKTEVTEYKDLRRQAVKSEDSKALIDLVFDPKLIKSTLWGADKQFNPIPWRMVLKQVESEELRKITANNKLAFDPKFNGYGTKVYFGEKDGFVSLRKAKKLILMSDKFDTRVDTDEFDTDAEKFDRLNITPNNNGCIDIGVFVTRLLRVMLRWNAKESDPRKKKDVTEQAYDIGRKLCAMVMYADYGIKISDKDADILLYRMFIYFLLGKSPYGTVGDELLFVLTYYSAKEWNGKPNTHRYLSEQLQLYLDNLSDPYNDAEKSEAWKKWAYNTHPVVAKTDKK